VQVRAEVDWRPWLWRILGIATATLAALGVARRDTVRKSG